MYARAEHAIAKMDAVTRSLSPMAMGLQSLLFAATQSEWLFAEGQLWGRLVVRAQLPRGRVFQSWVKDWTFGK